MPFRFECARKYASGVDRSVSRGIFQFLMETVCTLSGLYNSSLPALRRQVGDSALKPEERCYREADFTRVEGVPRRRLRFRRWQPRPYQGNAQAVSLVVRSEAHHFIVGGEKQRAELRRLPGKAVVHHGQAAFFTVGCLQVELQSRVEPAAALACTDAFG